jgi:hypothetical protein
VVELGRYKQRGGRPLRALTRCLVRAEGFGFPEPDLPIGTLAKFLGCLLGPGQLPLQPGEFALGLGWPRSPRSFRSRTFDHVGNAALELLDHRVDLGSRVEGARTRIGSQLRTVFGDRAQIDVPSTA